MAIWDCGALEQIDEDKAREGFLRPSSYENGRSWRDPQYAEAHPVPAASRMSGAQLSTAW